MSDELRSEMSMPDVTTIHVLYTPMHEEAREPAGDRWCFRCRKRLPHDDVLMVCDDPMSYYDPHWRRECSGCGGDYSTFPSGW